MTPNTGDIVLTWTVKPSMFNRLTTLATRTPAIPDPPHHVQTMRNNLTHFSNQPPIAVLIPHAQMIGMALAGVTDFAVYRWHEWVGMEDDYPPYSEYRAGIRSAIYIANDLRIPYDWFGPVALGWNAVRKHIPLLKNSKRFLNAYHKYFCSEGAEKYQLAAELDMFASLPEQPEHDGIPYRAPVHFARLVLAGKLVLVEDHGLHGILCKDEANGK